MGEVGRMGACDLGLRFFFVLSLWTVWNLGRRAFQFLAHTLTRIYRSKCDTRQPPIAI
jgi:hypothetical protein